MTQVKAKAKAKTRQPMPSSDATDSAAAAVAAAADPASADADGVEADADLDSSTSMFKKRPLAPPSTRIVAQQYQPPPVAFVPPPPSLGTSESSLTRIIELYGERTDLLRLVLSAKAEEDRARAEYERRVQEELRFETRRLDFEMLLHSNFFKQQERDQQLQQQLVLAPSIPPSHAHAVALHSPLGPPPPHYSHSQQQQQSTANGHAVTVPQPSYAMQPVVAAHEASGLRAYHHPDTPGGPDGRANQNPFAFFKLPPGAPLHHPSAYSEQQQQYTGQSSGGGMNSGGSGSSQMSSGGRPQPQQQQQQQQQQLSGGGSGPKARQQQQQPPPPSSVIRDRQPVMPAVSGLSVRILNHDRGLADAPRSAPVDGPGINKRPFSHEEVITALRRKVMGKGGVASVPVIAPRHVPPPVAVAVQSGEPRKQRRSSLAAITQTGDGDACSEAGEAVAAVLSMSSSSSSSSLSSPSLSSSSAASSPQPCAPSSPGGMRRAAAPRVSSISLIVDAETTAPSAASAGRPDVAA